MGRGEVEGLAELEQLATQQRDAPSDITLLGNLDASGCAFPSRTEKQWGDVIWLMSQ